MKRTSSAGALDTYVGSLVIAATGAFAKKGQGPDGDVRVIFDGANGFWLNYGIRIRYHVRSPNRS